MDDFAALVAKYKDAVKHVKIWTREGGMFFDLYPPGTSQKDILAPDYCPNCDELKRWNEQIRKKYDLVLADRDALVAERDALAAEIATLKTTAAKLQARMVQEWKFGQDLLAKVQQGLEGCRCGWFVPGEGCTYGGGLCPLWNRQLMNCPTIQEQTNAPRPASGP